MAERIRSLHFESHPGIVDEDVDASVLRQHGVSHTRDAGLVVQVQPAEKAFQAVIFQFCHLLSPHGFRPAGQVDVAVKLGDEVSHGGQSDATVGSGDDRHLHHGLSAIIIQKYSNHYQSQVKDKSAILFKRSRVCDWYCRAWVIDWDSILLNFPLKCALIFMIGGIINEKLGAPIYDPRL